ncbi:MAG TPA: hypothetical protein VNO30_18615 [Kofleriaceae bacterium]|nr:hypothetical protein [Kofleriaceae bacterium]
MADNHLFRGTLSINESFARTPVVDEFVKTNVRVRRRGCPKLRTLEQQLGACTSACPPGTAPVPPPPAPAPPPAPTPPPAPPPAPAP